MVMEPILTWQHPASLFFFSVVRTYISCVNNYKIHLQLLQVIAFSVSRDFCSRYVKVLAIFRIRDISLWPRYVKATSQIMHISSHSHLALLAETLVWCLQLSSLLKKFPAQFPWLLHLITFLIISYISLHPRPVGTGLAVFRCKPVAWLLLHLCKIPGRLSVSAKLELLFPAVYTSWQPPFQEKTPLHFTSGHTLINYVLLTTEPN